MKLNSDEYEPFLEGAMTVDQYVGTEVEPDKRDIDELSIHAFYACVIKPTGIIIDIVNLDRNSGHQAMIISLLPQSFPEGSSVEITDPMMSLLYHRQ